MPIRFAVIGTRRGRTFIQAAQQLEHSVRLDAICDSNETALQEWQGDSEVRCYLDYHQILNDPNIDAVCLATPVPQHARQAIAALEAGKHVLCEVTAAFTREESRELIETVERTGLTYMMAENYCFRRDVLMVQNMVEQGVFGELTFAEGHYIHDCRKLRFTEQGELTWRGEVAQSHSAHTYPTHSLGPVCRWLGINHTDRLQSMAAWQSATRALPLYARKRFGKENDYADSNYWSHPDTVTALIRTQNEVLIQSRLDWASVRPQNQTSYGLQGTTAAFTTQVDPNADPLIWIEDRSPTKPDGTALEWEPLWKYADEFEHPLWREHLEAASGAGHGGGDFFVLREFIDAINEDRPPLIDVYDAVTWSSITPFSAESIRLGNASVKLPHWEIKGREQAKRQMISRKSE